jgi:peroxiredoxin Q/BCP
MSIAVGQAAPAFTAPSTDGDISLKDYKGRIVVLYFYPRDNTPGCTTQGQNFRDQYAAFEAAGAVVLGISRDTLASHVKFKEKQEFPFPLVADPDETICNLYEVMKMKNMYGKQVRGVERSTFLIDAKGKLRQEWRGVKVPGHVDAVLEAVKAIA